MKGVEHKFRFEKNTGLVCLANVDDGYYYQVFENSKELKVFIDEANSMLSKMVLHKVKEGD
jgi:hypothetical protein